MALLSTRFTWRGRAALASCAERLAEVRQKVANYRFRELTDEWVDLMVELEPGTGQKQ